MISNKVILNFIILVVGFLSITTSVIGQKNSYIITGKVLDAERKPVANMAVYLAKPICTHSAHSAKNLNFFRSRVGKTPVNRENKSR